MVPPGGPETLYYVPWQTATRNSHREDEHLIKRAQCVHLTDNRPSFEGIRDFPYLSSALSIHPRATRYCSTRSPRLPSSERRLTNADYSTRTRAAFGRCPNCFELTTGCNLIAFNWTLLCDDNRNLKFYYRYRFWTLLPPLHLQRFTKGKMISYSNRRASPHLREALLYLFFRRCEHKLDKLILNG